MGRDLDFGVPRRSRKNGRCQLVVEEWGWGGKLLLVNTYPRTSMRRGRAPCWSGRMTSHSYFWGSVEEVIFLTAVVVAVTQLLIKEGRSGVPVAE